ncbi:MAG: ankyrin repeat domain-containing protein, partial [Bryobacteraceae bacterium]|nr:ankyrin repeat domain-containing protein [Bryobacteraceae bacterium]
HLVELTALAFDAPLSEYERQAEAVLAGLTSGEGLEEARLLLSRWYSFRDWAALSAYVEAVGHADSPLSRFEPAVEAVVSGGLDSLRKMLRENPQLVHARSERVTHFNPAVHRATLLHYVAANGVEQHRQKTPPNAVAIALALLQAGAEVDALADMYGGQCTTLSLLVSSAHPAAAGVQVALVNALLDHGAAVDGAGNGVSPLMTALIHGYRDAADTLVRRGASVDDVAAAAGLGLMEGVLGSLPRATAQSRHRALALAAQNGQAEVVRLLLNAGEDPDRYNPEGFHSHSTPLHQAALGGHLAVVRLLVDRGARRDLRDRIWHSTPFGWAQYAGHAEVAKFLASISSE